VKVKLISLPPAPVIDGFDVQQYRAGRLGETYDVEAKLGRYLIAAGYAMASALPLADAAERPRRKKGTNG
jgi:hypothetical protein